MPTDVNTVRLLGVAQVLVIISYFITEGLLASAVGSGSISEILVNITKNPSRMRIANLLALVESLAVIAMGVLYYVVFYKEYKIISLVALVCFSVAAITFTVSKIGTNALIPLSQEFVEAGAPETSYFQTLEGIPNTKQNCAVWYFLEQNYTLKLWVYRLTTSSTMSAALA